MTDEPNHIALLAMRGITKSFGLNPVLRGVDFEVRAGEVHALLGENGAGKSTLMKILLGVHAADAGEITLKGKRLERGTTRSRLDAGVAMVFQELSLVPAMTVAENIWLGREPRRFGGRVDRRAMKRDARALAEKHDLTIDIAARVEDLTFAVRQQVEILKALSTGASVIVMDEPTSSLTVREEAALAQTISNLRAGGIGIVFISHRMAEIFRLADRLSVMKDGLLQGPFPVSGISIAEVSRMLARGERANPEAATARSVGEVVLEVDALSTARKLRDVSFAVRSGEILGIAGLVGSGRSTLCKALFGLVPDARGTVSLGGRDIGSESAPARIRAGIAMVPEDRRVEGLVVQHALGANIGLPNLADLIGRIPFTVSRRKERQLFFEVRQALRIACRDADQPASELSGGNQQKVVFAKWFAANPKLLLLDEPTAGVDVNAKAEMRALVRQAAGRGLAVVLVTSELDELADLADRILFVADGRVVEGPGGLRSEEAIRTHLQHLTTLEAA
jgi:ABC-type sugar transport system ATPase subunit